MHEWVDALLWVCVCQYMGENLRLSVCQDDRQLRVWAVSENQFDKLPPPGKAPTQPSSGLRPGHTHFLVVWDTSSSYTTTSGTTDPAAPLLRTHINKSVTPALHFCLPGRSGGSQLLIFMSPALQVNCLRDSAVMNIRFETRGAEVGEKNWMQRRQGGENADFRRPLFPLSYYLYHFAFLFLIFASLYIHL